MVTRMYDGSARPVLALLALLAFLATPGFIPGAIGAAMAQTADDLERAREHYDFAEFEQALAILARVLERPGETAQRRRDAYVLQARCQVGLGNRLLAEDSFCEALAVDSVWRPDPIFFTRSEVEIFESARVGCLPKAAEPRPVVAPPVRPTQTATESKPFYKKPIVWAGAAVAVLAVVLLGGGGGDDDPDPLPDPPPPPTN